MLEGIGNIVAKEVKEMVRDPRILLGMILAPLLIFPLMGTAIGASTKAVEESTKTMSIAIIDRDKGPLAQNLTGLLRSLPGVNLAVLDSDIGEVASNLKASNVTAVIVVPMGFSANITSEHRGSLEVYAVFKAGGIAESVSFSMVQGLLSSFEQSLVRASVQSRFTENPQVVLDPVSLSQRTIVKGKPMDVDPTALYTFTQTQSFSLPMSLFMLIILAMQLAATSVASEKEEKTLETLMSLPVSRFTLLMGKLAGSTIVAAIGAVATIAGVVYYMGSLTFGSLAEMPTVDINAIGLNPGPLGYLVLGASVFLALLCALALAVVVSVFAEDVRGAQSLLGFVYLPLLVPMFVLMFADIQVLPMGLQLLLLALPFTHPMLAVRATITGDYSTAVLGIGYMAILTLAILFIAAKIFATEKILTAKIRLGRKSTGKPTPE